MWLFALPSTLLVLLIASPIANSQQEPLVWTYDIVAEYPHDNQAFTQGLVYFERPEPSFYESTGQYGQSTIRVADLASGKVIRSNRLIQNEFAEVRLLQIGSIC